MVGYRLTRHLRADTRRTNADALPERAADDITYLEPPRVIKWFRDPAAAARRVARGRDLAAVVPAIHEAPAGWLVHDFAEGQPLRRPRR